MITTNDPKPLKGNNINDIVSCHCTRTKSEEKDTVLLAITHGFFFFQTKDLIGESVFLGYLLIIFFL